MIKIIAGNNKGLVLKTPVGQHTRPTLSRIRESLFNILGHQLSGRFLDLYAGSGSVGFEAFSRGCDHVTFIENENQAIKVLESNKAKFKDMGHSLHIIKGDALAGIGLFSPKVKFDYIFLDPPYDQAYFDSWANRAVLSQQMHETSKLIVQHGKKNELSQQWATLTRFDCRTYGETKLSFYKKQL